MGACTSRAAEDPTALIRHGSIVFLSWDSAPSSDAVPYMVRTRVQSGGSPSWHSFQSCGLIHDVGGDALEAIYVRPSTDGSDLLVRMPLDQLTLQEGLKELAVACQEPGLTPTECKRVSHFASQVEHMPELSKRVRVMSAKGRKVFIAQMVADLLVAIGRHTKSADMYRAQSGSWCMPDITFVQLPGKPQPYPEPKLFAAYSGDTRLARRNQQQQAAHSSSSMGQLVDTHAVSVSFSDYEDHVQDVSLKDLKSRSSMMGAMHQQQQARAESAQGPNAQRTSAGSASGGCKMGRLSNAQASKDTLQQHSTSSNSTWPCSPFSNSMRSTEQQACSGSTWAQSSLGSDACFPITHPAQAAPGPHADGMLGPRHACTSQTATA